MTAPAAYVLMLGVLVELRHGLAAVGGRGRWARLLSVGYVFRGGLRAVVATDVVQFFLMFLAFLVLVPVCVTRFGGWSFLQANLPAGASELGRRSGLPGHRRVVLHRPVHPGRAGLLPALLRRPATKRPPSGASPRPSASGSVFDFLTTTAGLYARALLPDLADPVQAFPALAAAGAARLLAGGVHGGAAGHDHVDGRQLRLHRRRSPWAGT